MEALAMEVANIRAVTWPSLNRRTKRCCKTSIMPMSASCYVCHGQSSKVPSESLWVSERYDRGRLSSRSYAPTGSHEDATYCHGCPCPSMFSTLCYKLRNMQKHDTQGRKGHPEIMSSQHSEVTGGHVLALSIAQIIRRSRLMSNKVLHEGWGIWYPFRR
jgi:hypothetical protein